MKNNGVIPLQGTTHCADSLHGTKQHKNSTLKTLHFLKFKSQTSVEKV